MRACRLAVAVLAACAPVIVAQAAEPVSSGASRMFTSEDPTMERVRTLVEEGRLREAAAILDESGAGTPAADARTVDEAREVIRRLAREYSLEADELLSRVQRSIPDVTADDLERWRRAGEIQWRRINGEVRYFRREPSNLFRFCDEAKRRRDEHASRSSAGGPAGRNTRQELLDHLKEIIELARETGHDQVLPIRHQVTYKLTVLPNRPGAKAGSRVRCWLPFPQVYRQQHDVQLIRTSPADHILAPNAEDGATIGGAPQRTVYLERRIDDPAETVNFEMACSFVTAAYYPQLRDDDVRPLPDDFPATYLAERPPHIVFTPELRDAVRRAVGDATNPLEKARRIFHYIDREIRYCAEEEYSVIPSFSQKAITAGRGDCGIQSMLFITMCRAAGVPARWQSGWETQPGAWNMHDWAEFYVEPWGWLPADPSYGLKASDDPRVREFYFGHLDAYRWIVNLDYGCPLHPPKESLRSEPADFQRGEVELDGRNLYFDEWDWDLELDWERIGGPEPGPAE